MASWLEGPAIDTKGGEYDLLEFFAGSARISRLAKARGYRSIAVDTLYDPTAPPPRTKKKDRQGYPNERSAMDINTSAGLVSFGSEL